jgi:hypothetical protein
MSRKCTVLSSSSTPSAPDQPLIIMTRKRRTKVQCFCSKCNGNLVDPRTKRAHAKKEKSSTSETHSSVIPEAHEQKSTLESSISEIHSTAIPPEETHRLPIISSETPVFIESTVKRHSSPENNVDEEQTIIFLPRKKRVKTTLRYITNETIENKSDDSSGNGNVASDVHSAEFSEYSDDDGNDDGKDDGGNDEFFNNVFEDYSHPTFDLPEISKLSKNEFTWILI